MSLTALLLAGETILSAIGGFLVVEQDDLQPADVIHVLGCSNDRHDYAVQLYQRGYAQRLFVTGCSFDEHRERVIALGVRPEDISPDASWATSTYEEALELEELLEEGAALRSVIVVSSPYHMRRAQYAFNKVLGDRVTRQFAPVPFEMTRYEQRWWTDGRSRSMVVKEYLKIMGYLVKYGLF